MQSLESALLNISCTSRAPHELRAPGARTTPVAGYDSTV